jgi:hypothetical protein
MLRKLLDRDQGNILGKLYSNNFSFGNDVIDILQNNAALDLIDEPFTIQSDQTLDWGDAQLHDGIFLSFDGENDYVDLGKPSYLDFTPGTDEYAVWGWFTSDSGGNSLQSIIELTDSSNKDFGQLRLFIFYDDTNGYHFRLYLGGGYLARKYFFPDGVDYGDGNWHFFTLKTIDDSNLELYVDGNQLEETYNHATGTNKYDGDIILGKTVEDAWWWDGNMHTFGFAKNDSIYSKLTESNINWLMNNPNATPAQIRDKLNLSTTQTDGIYTEGLVGLFPMAEGSGDYIINVAQGLGENVCTNSFDWVDSDGDGVADDWGNDYDETHACSIVSGNGFDGSAQRFEVSDSNAEQWQSQIFYNGYRLNGNQPYYITGKFRGTRDLEIGYDAFVKLSTAKESNEGNAVRFHSIVYHDDPHWRPCFHIDSGGTVGEYLEIDEIEIRAIAAATLNGATWQTAQDTGRHTALDDFNVTEINVNNIILPDRGSNADILGNSIDTLRGNGASFSPYSYGSFDAVTIPSSGGFIVIQFQARSALEGNYDESNSLLGNNNKWSNYIALQALGSPDRIYIESNNGDIWGNCNDDIGILSKYILIINADSGTINSYLSIEDGTFSLEDTQSSITGDLILSELTNQHSEMNADIVINSVLLGTERALTEEEINIINNYLGG